jgi:hypothetical protein
MSVSKGDGRRFGDAGMTMTLPDDDRKVDVVDVVEDEDDDDIIILPSSKKSESLSGGAFKKYTLNTFGMGKSDRPNTVAMLTNEGIRFNNEIWTQE